ESSIPQLAGFESYLAGENKITTILCAVGLFLGFKNLKMRYHPWLNRVAASMFSVYLIQENNFIHPLIWSKWFKNRLYSWSSDLWIHALVCIVIVIVVCTVIDQIRIYWIERPDRKSTRLNSSHVSISYAVFCLKKKKNYNGVNVIFITIT